MNIALIAQDRKKELMVQFCIAYCGILSKHTLCATATTGKLISEATGLQVDCYLAGHQGGDQQIGARVSYDEIDMVIFLRDPAEMGNVDVDEMVRLCDERNVPIATNLATAEMLVLGLDRGDLDWRELVRKK